LGGAATWDVVMGPVSDTASGAQPARAGTVPALPTQRRYVLVRCRPMRRDSALAAKVVASLEAEGTKVTGRRLEDWGRAGLLPPQGTDAAIVVDQCRHLASLLGSGKGSANMAGYDRAALALAGRGLACERYRDALCRSLGYASSEEHRAQLPCPPQDDVDSEDIFAAIETFGAALGAAALGALDETNHALRAPAAELRKITRKAQAQLDPITETVDTPEATASSIMTALSEIVIGDGHGSYGYGAIAAMSGRRVEELTDEQTDELEDLMNDVGGRIGPEVEQVTANAPIAILAKAGLLARRFFLAGHPDTEATDILAGRMAPGTIVFVRRVAPLVTGALR